MNPYNEYLKLPENAKNSELMTRGYGRFNGSSRYIF